MSGPRPTRKIRQVGFSVLGIALGLLAARGAEAARARVNHEAKGFTTFTSPQVNPLALSPDGTRLYVVNTTSGTVNVIDTGSLYNIAEIEVGMEPSGVSVRPDGLEVWVTNHVSDSVSVIDPSINRVVDTISPLDAKGVTTFDEPAGIAFASNTKAYVALSSRNQIAVIDVASRTVTSRIQIPSQEPRAIAVRNGLLYVAAFESGNQSELSVCPTLGGTQCTLDNADLGAFVTSPNIPGETKHIIIDPDVPDRDLYVFDTATDTQVSGSPLSGVGTLLYGVAVNSLGRAFVTQTDARNHLNGLEGQNLIDLDNRMFSNEIAAVTCTVAGCGAVTVTDLEGASPTHATALATPYGIAVSGDDSTLVATAAGSSRVFTVNAATMAVLGRLDLGVGADAGQQIPKGVALRSGPGGAPQTAYVLNTLENTVSVIDVSDTTPPVVLTETAQIGVGTDPTPLAVRKGNIAFNNGFLSDTGTFSCGSCHPDGNVDQLLWRIGGACTFGACTGDDEPRTTMPVRGLKNTLPLHWDGTLGDPFGGGNGAIGSATGNGGTDCSLGGADADHDCFVDLANASLSGVMCDQSGTCNPGGNQASAQEIDDMATFLASVSYPPARSRRLNDTISTATTGDTVPVPNGDGTSSTTQSNALKGFKAFFTNQGGPVSDPDTCADSTAGCHELPLGSDTNSTTLAGFDVPTMRGMTDRFLQFSLGITNAEEMLVQANSGGTITLPQIPIPITFPALIAPLQWNPSHGFREITTFGAAFAVFTPIYATAPTNIFQMFEEASTGYSGALGRQVTLNATTTTGGALAGTDTLLTQLETADARGLVNLRGTGRYGSNTTLSYRAGTNDYLLANGSTMTHGELITQAQAGLLIATLTGFLPKNVGASTHPQPVLDHTGTGSGLTGDPPIPSFSPTGGSVAMTVVGTDLRCGGTSGNCTEPVLYVDGQPAAGSVSCTRTGDFCVNGNVTITLNTRPTQGLHLLQVQNALGPLSNELPICSGTQLSHCRD